MTLRLVRDTETEPAAPNAAPGRYTRPPDLPHPAERSICSEPAAGGLTLYTFEDYRGNVIGYAMIALAPIDGMVPRQVVELYDLCAAEAASHSLRMG